MVDLEAAVHRQLLVIQVERLTHLFQQVLRSAWAAVELLDTQVMAATAATLQQQDLEAVEVVALEAF